MGYSQEEWTPLLTHKKMAGHRDAQSHALCKSNQNNCKQNSPGTVVSWRHSLFQASHGLMFVGGGGVKTLPFCLGTAYNVCSMEDIASLGCYVDNESMSLKILFISVSKASSGTSTNPCFPLRRAYLFTFMLSHYLLLKSTSWRAPLSFACIAINLH